MFGRLWITTGQQESQFRRRKRKDKTYDEDDLASEAVKPVLGSTGRFDNPIFRRHPPMEVIPEDIPELHFGSCYPVSIPANHKEMSELTKELMRNGPVSVELSPYVQRHPRCTPPMRVDCRRVTSVFGAAVSKLCGYQPVMLRRKQHVIVMQHGERKDFTEPEWAASAKRPWDPPLTDWGKWQAYQAGSRLRQEGMGVTRIVCSPYLRCIETALEVIKALMSEDESGAEAREGPIPGKDVHARLFRARSSQRRLRSIKKSGRGSNQPSLPIWRVRVSFDYGLCEVMSSQTDPQQTQWLPPVEELEKMFPADMIDQPSEAAVKLPSWPENMQSAIVRFVATIDRVAEQFLDENIIMISHAEAVHSSVVRCQKTKVSNILFGAYTHMKRNVYFDPEDDDDRGVGVWHLATKSGTSGVFF